MALRLRQAIPGRPNVFSSTSQNHRIAVVLAGDGSNVDDHVKGYIVYPSGPNVILLTPDSELAETLPFHSALPHRASSSVPTNVEGVTSFSNLIIAWSNVNLVIWQYMPSKVGSRGSWIVHSTILASSSVRCVDYQAGTLVLGTQSGVEYWRTDPKGDIVVWDKLWERSYNAPIVICISPLTGHVAWYEQMTRVVYVLTIGKKGQPVGKAQELRHPREIEWIGWRKPSSTSGDAHLYTITTNSVFRIYCPVLDDPTWFQLLASVDHKAFARSSETKGKSPEMNQFGTMIALDAGVLRPALTAELDAQKKQKTSDVKVIKIIEDLLAEDGDIIMWLGPDGSVTLRSILNMDRKPPTLLNTSPISSPKLPSSLNSLQWSSATLLLHIPGSAPTLFAIIPPSDAQPSITSPQISLPRLLTSKPYSMKRPSIQPPSSEWTTSVQLGSPIDRFVRTPNGRGLLAVGESGEIGTWFKQQMGLRPDKWQNGPKTLIGKGQWQTDHTPRQAAIFAKGRAIVFYSSAEDGTAKITLQHLDAGASTPRPPVTLPHFDPSPGDEVEMLLAVSDIDDGYSGKGRRTQRAIVMAATRSGEAWVWRIVSKITPAEALQSDEIPDIHLLSHYRLPLDEKHVEEGSVIVRPVDPMGWHSSVIDWTTDTPLQDMILTVSADGDLEFWTPKIGQHLVGQEVNDPTSNHDAACAGDNGTKGDAAWTRTGVVRTERRNVVNARCSSRKKTVLVCELPDGRHEMTIWDSNVSEFSTGLELTHVFEAGEIIQDLDWTTTSDLQSVLAVGFAHKVVLVCEQRMSYVESTPGWAPFLTIDMERYTPVPINDSIWLAGGSLAVGTGNQIYLFSRFLDRGSPIPSPNTSAKSVTILGESDEPEDIFQLIAHQNGPLVDYHPVLLGQCLLWNKSDLVKTILSQLLQSLRNCENTGKRRLTFPRSDPSEFYTTRKGKHIKSVTRKYDGLFDSTPVADDDEDDFTDRAVSDLVDRLHGSVILPMSQAEKTFLATLAQATVEAENQRRSLDVCGLRYLISLRMYANWDRLSGKSGTVTPASSGHGSQTPASASGRNRNHFSFRNIVWATHSESQELLLSAATECCIGGKMKWEDAKRLGVFLWLKSHETIKSQLEIIARNRFMADEDRDPTSCSLIFFALGKKKVVHGLWRQAPGHKEQTLMLKFLANDFEQERWKTAALKNAYALLSKQRYEYAAAFFMLAGQPKDAINICVRQLDDWQLAVALAKAVEQPSTSSSGTTGTGTGDVGPLLSWIIKEIVVPLAFRGGHRWLATWAFWTLGRRDLAVRVLISPMNDVAEAYNSEGRIEVVGNTENDDPSLLLMFQHLKSKSLLTAKGASEISTKLEFDFVLHNARVFFRMGCHNLALDLIRSWSFERPFFPTARQSRSRYTSIPPTPSATSPTNTSKPPLASTTMTSPTRPTLNGLTSTSYVKRRPSFMLSSTKKDEDDGFTFRNQGRGLLMDMDMDTLDESNSNSLEPSRAASPALPPSSTVPAPVMEEAAPAKSDNLGEVNGVNGPKEEMVSTSPPIKEDVSKKEQSWPPPKKVGNLMKELKQDVQQGAMEFNMDNFF